MANFLQQLRWRVGQRQEVHRGRPRGRQGLRGPQGRGHRRHRRRPVQGHRRPGAQPAHQGDEPGVAADPPGDHQPAQRRRPLRHRRRVRCVVLIGAIAFSKRKGGGVRRGVRDRRGGARGARRTGRRLGRRVAGTPRARGGAGPAYKAGIPHTSEGQRSSGRRLEPQFVSAGRIDHHAPTPQVAWSRAWPREGVAGGPLRVPGQAALRPLRDPRVAGAPVDTVAEAVEAADRIGYPVVVKAQVQVGGRGKAGGIKLAADADEARTHAEAILGMDIKGHTVEVRLDREGERHRRGVLRVVHPRPGRQAAPRDALGAGRRRDRAGRRGEPRRHRQDPRRPGRRAERGAVPRVGGGRRSSTRQATDGAVDILLKLYRALRRRRRRPRGDQPADPHARRARARARRQGHPRRQRGLPPPRLRRVRRHPGARRARAVRARAGPAVRRARRLRRRDRQRRRARDEHRRHREPGRRRARPTSSTSAAAPTPT